MSNSFGPRATKKKQPFFLSGAIVVLIILLVGAIFHLKSSHQHNQVQHVNRHVTGILSVQNWVTPEGLRVYFVPSPELPMVDMQLAFDAGSARDTTLLGLAQLTNTLIGQGSKYKAADEIAEKLESLGAQFSSETRRDLAVMNLRSLTAKRYLDPALDLLKEVLETPSFNDDNITREKARLISEIQSSLEKPDAVAKRAFYLTIYQNHPYANPIQGEEETVARIAAKDIMQFYTQHYNAKNAVLAIVGDLDLEKAQAVAAEISEALPKGAELAALPAVPDLRQSVQYQVEFPSSQTHIMQGAPALRRDDSDYYNLYVGNHILGGGSLVSQLFDKVRERRGLVYDVHSYFLPLREQGPFIIGLQSRNEEVKEALAVVEETLRDFVKNGPSEDELAAAKKNITGSFNLQFSSNRTIVGQLAMLGFYKLPLDYFDTFRDKINDVTKEEIRGAFNKHVHPDSMATVMVGPAPK